MERKKLLKSQKELLRIKRLNINASVADFNSTLANIALELEIPEKEMNLWRLSRNDEYLEKTIENKKPEMKIPEKKKA